MLDLYTVWDFLEGLAVDGVNLNLFWGILGVFSILPKNDLKVLGIPTLMSIKIVPQTQIHLKIPQLHQKMLLS